MFGFVLFFYLSGLTEHDQCGNTEEKTEVNCSQCSALYSCFCTHTHTHIALKSELNDSLLWEKQSAGERGGLQQLISPDAQLLREKRRKPAAQSIHEESASSGLLAQSAAAPVSALCTGPGEGRKMRERC